MGGSAVTKSVLIAGMKNTGMTDGKDSIRNYILVKEKSKKNSEVHSEFFLTFFDITGITSSLPKNENVLKL